jgi:hypothetical protein
MREKVHFSIFSALEFEAVGKDIIFSFPSFPVLSRKRFISHYLSHLDISALLSNVSSNFACSDKTYSVGLHE